MVDNPGGEATMRPNDLCTAAYLNDVPKLKELLAVPDVEEEPPLPVDFDPAIAAEEDDALNEEEAAEAQARQEQRTANKATIARLLATQDVLISRLSVVNVKRFGLFVHLREEDSGEGPACRLRTFYKPSPHSTFRATPLHWAVLGHSHEAVDYLCSLGAQADALAELPVTSTDIAIANRLEGTLRVLKRGTAQYAAACAAERARAKSRAALIAERAAQVEAFKEKRRREAEAEEAAEAEPDEANDEPVEGE